MARVTPRIPAGFPEYLPGDQILFNHLLEIVRATYERYGFTPLDTSGLELTEVLLAKEAGETGRQIYRVASRGDTDLMLPFDLTVPLARYVAQYQRQLVFPFRRYHIGRVHRAERPQAGRFREFYQCDIDVIGSDSPIVDAEFPAIINEIFEQFGFGEFTIRLNDRRLLNGFFESIGLSQVSAQVLRTIDKMEKITRTQLVAELQEAGLNREQVDYVLRFTQITGTNDDILGHLRVLSGRSALLDEGISRLTQLVMALRSMGVPERRFQIDLRIARGLDYYTGTVYETILNDHPEIGSVCSGGRYDDLSSHYTDTKLTGVGISIGLTRLYYALRQAGIIQPSTQTPARVVVMPLEGAQIPTALAVASLLRQNGVSTMLYTEPNGPKQKLQYANRMGFPYVVLIGEREMAAGQVTVKNMQTGASMTVPAQDLLAIVAQ
jgi:histidyl-tRNA synthetase